MLEIYLESPRRLARAEASPFGPYLEGFASSLHGIDYCLRVGESCITYSVHLGTWAAAHELGIGALDETVVDAFLAHLPECRCPGKRAGHHALARPRIRVFMHYLREAGILSPPAAPTIARPRLVTEFCAWMLRQRGLTKSTLRNYGRVAARLVERLGDDASRFEARTLREAVREVTGGHGRGMAKLVVTVARAFLRYLTVEGRCRPGLDAAILPPARWRLASLPRYVSAEAVDRIVGSCDPASPCGLRDRAVLLLLARLGLRGGDIVNMRLCDIEWANARLCVVGKGRREARLPLPQEVGDAILAYLRKRHPAGACDRVFLRARAPWRPFDDSSSVSAIVRRAILRAGVSAPVRGAHLLRHSAATALLREGVSLPSIGAILRHSSVETTAHYAKVDVEMLRSVAQPWPGGASC